MKPRHRNAGILLVLALTACAYPREYRFENGTVLQPTTQQIRRGLAVDIPIEPRFGGGCMFAEFRSSGVTGQFKYSFPLSLPTLRLIFPEETKRALEIRGDLEGGIRDAAVEILRAAGDAKCLEFDDPPPDVDADGVPDDIAEMASFVARQARARWPMNVQQAVATWYGPGAVRFIDGDAGEPPRPEGQDIFARVTFLRPGMRVCAHDVADPASTSSENVYTVAGTACATVIDGPTGMAFSGTTPALDLPYTGNRWQPGGFEQVTSWEEVQTGDEPHQFAVVHPTKLPAKPPNPVAENGAFIVRFNPSKTIGMQADFCVMQGLATNECPAYAAFQAVGRSFRQAILCSTDSGNVCIRFGKRSVFTVEIPITVNGARTHLPAGSTLAAVLGQIAPDFLGPPNPSIRATPYQSGPDRDRLKRLIRKVRLYRWYDGKRYRVRLGERPVDGQDVDEKAFDMPLQPGDEIRW